MINNPKREREFVVFESFAEKKNLMFLNYFIRRTFLLKKSNKDRCKRIGKERGYD